MLMAANSNSTLKYFVTGFQNEKLGRKFLYINYTFLADLKQFHLDAVYSVEKHEDSLKSDQLLRVEVQ